MADLTLDEALDRCIDRLNAGASVADCLAEFPQYAAALESLLESGLVLRGAQARAEEAAAARERGRLSFEQALQRPSSGRSRSSSSRLLSLVASVALVSLFFLGGAGILAENSIPGDPLYGLKRWTETLRLAVIPDPVLADIFAQRRIDEAKEVVSQGRVTNVQFTGEVESVGVNIIVVEGLRVIVPDARDIAPGTRLSLRANASSDGSLFASEIRYLETPEPTAPPLPTESPEQSATSSPTAVSTPRPSATQEPSATLLPTRRASPSPTLTSAPCDTPTPPEGWQQYSVLPGDTASQLAASTGLTLDEFAAANCLDDLRNLVVGQPVYLPRPPQRPPSATPTIRPSETPQVRPSDVPPADRPQRRPSATPSRRNNNDGGGDDNGSDGGDQRR
jgi:hypothetical protein